ncbi:MAG: LruC domain-containing protein [Balneolales bacterium]|nr:LruC domain-containing protein [Balneolales bacterium]
MIRQIKNIAIAGIMLAVVAACDSKMTSFDDDNISFGDLVVSESFTWSNAKHIDLNINFPDDSLVGSMLEVRNTDGALLSKLHITEGGITYSQPIPSHIEELVLFHPASQTEQLIDARSSDVEFNGASSRGFDPFTVDEGDADLQSFSIINRYHMWEDLWPGFGDYDFNDYVLRSVEVYARDAQNRITNVDVSMTLVSIGASNSFGLGVQVFAGTDATRRYLPTNSIVFDTITNDPLASNTGLITQNLKDHTPEWNTFGPIFSSDPTVFTFGFPWDVTHASNLVPQLHFFLFKTGERSREIHTVGNPPTEAASTALFGTSEDNSSTSTWNRTPGTVYTVPAPFYRSDKFLPWGMSLLVTPVIQPQVVREKVEISDAYPFFKGWAQSEGTTNQSWWLFPLESQVLIAP